MIDLNTEKYMFAIKIIDLNAEMFIEKIILALVFKMNGGGIYMVITLMNYNTTVLLQIFILGFEIWYLGTIIYLLVPCLIHIITKGEYF